MDNFNEDELMKRYQARRQAGLYAPQQQAPQQQQPQAPQGATGIGGIVLDLLPFGRVGEKIVTGRSGDIGTGELLTEAALTAIPFGLGRIGKAGKAAKAAVRAGRGADDLTDIQRLSESLALTEAGGKSLKGAAKQTAGANVTERFGRNQLRSALGVDQITAANKFTPTTIFKGDELVDEAMKLGVSGGPRTIQRQLGEQYTRINDSVNRLVAQSTDTRKIGDVFNDTVKKLRTRLPKELEGVSTARSITQNKNLLKEIAGGNTINAAAIKAFKDELPVDRIFKKISSGGNLTAKEVVDLEFWNAADDIIGQLAPKAKQLTKRQSRLYGLSQGTAAIAPVARGSMGLGELGVNILTNPVRSMQSRIGQRAASAGAAQAANPIGANLAGQAALRSPRLFGEEEQAPQASEGDLISTLSTGLGTLEGGQQMQQPQQTLQDQQREYFRNLMLQDLQQTGGENIEQIALAAQLYGVDPTAEPEATGPNVTKVTAQQYGLAQTGYNALQQLKQLLQSDPEVLSRARTPGRTIDFLGIGGEIANQAGTGEFDAFSYNIADTLLRLRTGAQANEEEVRKLQSQIMPRPGDSQATIQTKLQQLEEAFAGVLNQANNASATTDLSVLTAGGQ